MTTLYRYDLIISIWPHHIDMTTTTCQVLFPLKVKTQMTQPFTYLPFYTSVIWLNSSHWYDHISWYRLSKSLALTSVMNDCSESQHVIWVSWSHWYDHIDMIVLIRSYPCYDSRLILSWLVLRAQVTYILVIDHIIANDILA